MAAKSSDVPFATPLRAFLQHWRASCQVSLVLLLRYPQPDAAAQDCACSRLRPASRCAGGMCDASGSSGAPASPPACYLICHNVSKKHNGASALL